MHHITHKPNIWKMANVNCNAAKQSSTSASLKTDAKHRMVSQSQNYFQSWDNHFRFDGNCIYCCLNSQVNDPKAFGWQESTPSDQRCQIFFSRWTPSSILVVGWCPVAVCTNLLVTMQGNSCTMGENRPLTAISGQTGSRNMAETA